MSARCPAKKIQRLVYDVKRSVADGASDVLIKKTLEGLFVPSAMTVDSTAAPEANEYLRHVSGC